MCAALSQIDSPRSHLTATWGYESKDTDGTDCPFLSHTRTEITIQ